MQDRVERQTKNTFVGMYMVTEDTIAMATRHASSGHCLIALSTTLNCKAVAQKPTEKAKHIFFPPLQFFKHNSWCNVQVSCALETSHTGKRC